MAFSNIESVTTVSVDTPSTSAFHRQTQLQSPTESELLIRDFLARSPELDADLGPIQSDIELAPSEEMTNSGSTGRYTDKEWAEQIRETQKRIQVDAKRKVQVPHIGSKEFAATVDHTLLKLDARTSQIDALCSEARTEGFKSVCVRLNHVQRCVSNLKGSSVVVACVIGFHEGTQDTYEKLREARAAVTAGASELDVVLNYRILTKKEKTSQSSGQSSKGHRRDSTADTITWKNTQENSKRSSPPSSGPYSVPGSASSKLVEEEEENLPNYSAIYNELAAIRSLCPAPTVLKLIFETSQLTSSEIVAASHLAAAANFDFIKTSTGFNGPGANLSDVQIMVAAAKYLSTRTKSNGGSPVRHMRMQVKASGGIRSLNDAIQMLEAGATRLGTSSGLWIMQESRKTIDEKAGKRRIGISRLYTDDSNAGY